MTYIAKCFIAVGIIATTLWGGYTVDYSPSEFSFYKENGFDRVKAINFALIGEPGTPELPAVYLNYIIPPYAKVESLIVSQSNINQISGSYLIYPAQPPHKPGESIPWVDPDSLICNSDELFPGEFVRIISHGVMDGARIVTIEVRPLQYRPKSKRLFLVRNITFEFSFGPNTMPELRPQIRGKYEQAVYDAAIKQVVVNDNEIPVYYQPPTLVEENQIGTMAPIPGAPGVIIAPNEFHNAFQDYANWMTDRGIRTILLSPQYIYSLFPQGRDNAEKIRLYIQWCYQHAGGTYFILGGDDYFLPVRYGIPYDSVYPGHEPGENDSVPCDMYFSDLSGEWNAENNGQGDDYWGEIIDDDADRFPEVYVGRITAYNVDEVNQWVDKILNYEISPGNIGDNFITASWIYNDNLCGFAWQRFPEQFNNNHHFLEDQYAYPTVFNELNSGYGFVTVNCHGDIGCFRTRNIAPYSYVYNYYEDSLNHHAGLNWLTNENQYYICYSFSCHCGAYDCHAHTHPHYPNGSDTCIADAFVDAYSNRGTCAYLGNTRDGLVYWPGNHGPSHVLEWWFYEILFSKQYPEGGDPGSSYSCLGVAEALSKCDPLMDWFHPDYRYVSYSHDLFGSPATEAWTNIPGYIRVSHPRRIWVGVQTQFTVTVRDAATNDYVPYAKVCLNKPNDIYEVGLTDIYGQITFRITPHSIGTLKVTVTRTHNYEDNYIQYYPSRTTCRVYDEGSGGEQASGTDKILPTVLCITEMPTILKKNALMKFGIPRQGDISISVYSATGSRVKLTKRENLLPGYYQEKLNIRNLASGVYFIVLKQDNEKVNKKFLLVK